MRSYTKLVAAATLFLIYAGAMVTSTGSGLAVPDWPLSYGMLMPPMVGGIFYEHGHRMVAATVGLLTLIQAFWLQKRAPRPFVRKLGWIALAAVIVQGLLGGLTVIFLLPKTISISHAALAEIFFCITISIAFFSSRFYEGLSSRKESGTADARVATRALVAIVFVQILLGAWMRHLGAGLAIPDFPLAFGRLVPQLDSIEIVSNFLHRVGAIAVVVVALIAGGKIRKAGEPLLLRFWWGLIALIGVQITLGAFTIWSEKEPIVTSFHVMTGAATLALTLILALTAGSLARSGGPVVRESYEQAEATA
ncbi:MAG TPA: COX15/CtaA family protein [Thermoanaerobaculia bacterium]|nr:COX15/CtaA family protein [Thermoanaerobaculia bacterium]